jgi:hypothetical protein
MAKNPEVVTPDNQGVVTETPATPVVAAAPVKVELTLEELFAKLAERETAINAGIQEIVDSATSMNITDMSTAPGFMKTAYEGLLAQKEGIAKERSALANKVPMENLKNYMKQLAATFATFGFTEKVSIGITFDPATNLVDVASGGTRRAASAGGAKKEGGNGSAVRNKKTFINEVEYASASEGLKALRPMLGLPDTFGDGNSAVRVLESLAKNPDYAGKFTLRIVEG